jgi:hypothetical protein
MNIENEQKPVDQAQCKRRNNSTLSYVDCCMRLTGDRSFYEMSNDDLDSIYFVAYNRWAWHMTRQGLIDALIKRKDELMKKSAEFLTK